MLDCLKSEIPDLILMNANMFGMDGYEVLRRIKEDKETKEIPVILMMNVKDIQSELRGLEEGAIDFISLPFEPVSYTHLHPLIQHLFYCIRKTGFFNAF